jgi:hypothetical protein
MTDYRDYYLSNLEGYLLGQVRTNFLQLGFLSQLRNSSASSSGRQTAQS